MKHMKKIDLWNTNSAFRDSFDKYIEDQLTEDNSVNTNGDRCVDSDFCPRVNLEDIFDYYDQLKGKFFDRITIHFEDNELTIPVHEVIRDACNFVNLVTFGVRPYGDSIENIGIINRDVLNMYRSFGIVGINEVIDRYRVKEEYRNKLPSSLFNIGKHKYIGFDTLDYMYLIMKDEIVNCVCKSLHDSPDIGYTTSWYLFTLHRFVPKYIDTELRNLMCKIHKSFCEFSIVRLSSSNSISGLEYGVVTSFRSVDVSGSIDFLNDDITDFFETLRVHGEINIGNLTHNSITC